MLLRFGGACDFSFSARCTWVTLQLSPRRATYHLLEEELLAATVEEEEEVATTMLAF